MSNIDNIIDKIKAEAEGKISVIQKDSVERNQKVKSEIINKANSERIKILENAKEKADNTYARISENVEVRIRDQRLRERQNLIDRVFKLALTKMNSKSDSEFIEEINGVLGKINSPNLTLRVPKSRLEAIKKANLAVEVDNENFVDNGFILMSDKMNYNYKYEDILADQRAELGPQLIDFLS